MESWVEQHNICGSVLNVRQNLIFPNALLVIYKLPHTVSVPSAKTLSFSISQNCSNYRIAFCHETMSRPWGMGSETSLSHQLLLCCILFRKADSLEIFFSELNIGKVELLDIFMPCNSDASFLCDIRGYRTIPLNMGAEIRLY